jgi:hypothetical protein
MIATHALPSPLPTVRTGGRRRRPGIRHRRRTFLAAARRPGIWMLLLDDRQGIRLKLAILALCVIAAGLLEVR